MTPWNSEQRSGPKRVQTARPSAPKGGRRVSRLPSYRNRQRFPESNNSYRQLRLLLAGCMPLIRSKLSARLHEAPTAIPERRENHS